MFLVDNINRVNVSIYALEFLVDIGKLVYFL